MGYQLQKTHMQLLNLVIESQKRHIDENLYEEKQFLNQVQVVNHAKLVKLCIIIATSQVENSVKHGWIRSQ